MDQNKWADIVITCMPDEPEQPVVEDPLFNEPEDVDELDRIEVVEIPESQSTIDVNTLVLAMSILLGSIVVAIAVLRRKRSVEQESK